MSFLVDVSNLTHWEDVKSDMNCIFSKGLKPGLDWISKGLEPGLDWNLDSRYRR